MDYPNERRGSMKSLISLWSSTANELAVRCCTSATRDIKTVAARAEHEGLWFLAVTLADLGKATERWLESGFVDPSMASSFKTAPFTSLPAFLQGFYGRVFNPSNGVLLDNPDTEAIYAIRQLTLMFGKIALPGETEGSSLSVGGGRKVVSAERERLAVSEYVQCEHDVRASDERMDPAYLAEFKRVSEMLFGETFAKVNRDVDWGRIIPQHGPGAVADRLSANAKWDQRTWTARLQQFFPAEEHLASNPINYRLFSQDLNIVEPGAEVPVRVISVPKTLKTPRLIAIEPTCTQYVQQGLYRAILDALKEDDFLSRVIGFDDQIPNREMAREGSLSGDLATLDLSEASDRVSNQHVLTMLEDYPHLSGAVQASRSLTADVPGHGCLGLSKFASMGSALCFPFEAMVFLTIVFLGIEKELSAPFSSGADFSRFRKQVRVFGDDIIVPRDNVLSVVDELEYFGFRVNVGKSFWTGRFRESCGKEYYDGVDVSIVRVRQVLPTQRHDASAVISAVSLRNQAYWSGLWQTARWLDGYLGELLEHFPNVAPTSAVLGRETALGYEFRKLHSRTQSPLVRGYIERSQAPSDPLDGPGALLKCLSRRTPAVHPRGFAPKEDRSSYIDVESVDESHLERYGRPKRVSIKLGWISPF